MEKRTKKLVTCTLCWKEYMWYWWSKYCSDECANKVHQEKNKISARKQREKEKICKTCWITFVTSSNAKNCPDCFHKIYYCPCGNLKSTETATLCTECLKKRKCIECWNEIWTSSWKAVRCKECQSKRRKIAARDRSREKFNSNKWGIAICNKCWDEFEVSRGRCSYCEKCSVERVTCPDCWKKKKWNRIRCKSCNMKDKWRDPERNAKLLIHFNNLMKGVYWNSNKNSWPNMYWERFFNLNWIKYEREFGLNNTDTDCDNVQFRYDFKIGKYLIDINPTWTHSSTHWYRKFWNKKDTKYHYYKTSVAEQNWYQCIHIFDWDDTPKVKKWLLWLLKKRKRLYASEIKTVDAHTAMNFCDKNHLQWRVKSTIWYWLYKGDSLINLMGFIYFPKTNERHLSRFVSLSWYYVAHWAEKLFKHFISVHSPEVVISYSDRTKHSWNLYKQLWFTTEEISKPSYWWVDMKTNIPYRRRNCQKKSMHLLPHFDKEYKYKGNEEDAFWKQTEDEIMISKGYTKVCDSGNRRHVRTKSP